MDGAVQTLGEEETGLGLGVAVDDAQHLCGGPREDDGVLVNGGQDGGSIGSDDALVLVGARLVQSVAEVGDGGDEILHLDAVGGLDVGAVQEEGAHGAGVVGLDGCDTCAQQWVGEMKLSVSAEIKVEAHVSNY